MSSGLNQPEDRTAECPAVSPGVSNSMEGGVPGCLAVSRPVSQRPATSRVNENSKTNPIAQRLSARQFAAARWVVQGMSSAEVAEQMNTTARTINRWKRLDSFRYEVRRLHELIAMQMSRPTPARPAARKSEPSFVRERTPSKGGRMTGSEIDETEALIEKLLRDSGKP